MTCIPVLIVGFAVMSVYRGYRFITISSWQNMNSAG
jgi:hypothetical protein